MDLVCSATNSTPTDTVLSTVKTMKLRVWHIPQVPGTAFRVSVKSIDEAVLVINTLAFYDLFQLEHNIKGDFCNVAGLEVFEKGEWVEWYSEDDEDSISDVIIARSADNLDQFSSSKSTEAVPVT